MSYEEEDACMSYICHIYIYIHAYTYTYTYIYMHIHTCIRIQVRHAAAVGQGKMTSTLINLQVSFTHVTIIPVIHDAEKCWCFPRKRLHEPWGGLLLF